jgi:hypothetical protein
VWALQQAPFAGSAIDQLQSFNNAYAFAEAKNFVRSMRQYDLSRSDAGIARSARFAFNITITAPWLKEAYVRKRRRKNLT